MNSRIKKNLKYNLFFLVFLFFLFSNINYVFALDINYPRLPGARPPQDFVGNVPSEEVLSHYINYIFNFIIWISGILAFVVLVFAGIQYLISTGKPEKIISAKERMSAAFLGILLLLASFLILKTISPQFVILEIPKPEPIEIIKKPEIPLPSIEAIRTSIDTEMPIGRIIEKVLETYISDYPKPEEEKEPRMKRIKEIAQNTVTFAESLANNSQTLRDLVLPPGPDQCECSLTTSECRLVEKVCIPIRCHCDPCRDVRDDIQSTENDNLGVIANFVEEQRKTNEEIHSLKTELGRLERAESFIGECPFHTLTHFTQFLVKKDAFEEENLTLREIKFWDDGKPDEVNIVYNKKYNGEQKPEYEVATFYCAVSGTLEEKYPFELFAPSEEALTGEESEEEADRVIAEAMACSKEAPVGEITDRALRTGKLLVEKMEKLFEGGKKMIDAVDKLQVLVSQCSSSNCNPRCLCIPCPPPDVGCCGCTELRCSGNPCPTEAIEEILVKIKEIQEEINKLVNGKLEGETLEEKEENIGIIAIIDEMVPEILKELELTIRYPMKHCASKEWEEQETILLNCSQAVGATAPGGKVINFCCHTYYWEGNEKKQTPFGDCFGECYLEKGQEERRKCVQECLNRKGKELNDKDLPLCLHYLNFYCCHAKE